MAKNTELNREPKYSGTSRIGQQRAPHVEAKNPKLDIFQDLEAHFKNMAEQRAAHILAKTTKEQKEIQAMKDKVNEEHSRSKEAPPENTVNYTLKFGRMYLTPKYPGVGDLINMDGKPWVIQGKFNKHLWLYSSVADEHVIIQYNTWKEE